MGQLIRQHIQWPRRTHSHHRRGHRRCCPSPRWLRTEVTQNANITVNSPRRKPLPPGGMRSPCSVSGAHTTVQAAGRRATRSTRTPTSARRHMHGRPSSHEGHRQRSGRSRPTPWRPTTLQLHHHRSGDRHRRGSGRGAHLAAQWRAVKVEGIVTAPRTAGGRGYWIQDSTPDANSPPRTRCSSSSTPPAAQIGDSCE